MRFVELSTSGELDPRRQHLAPRLPTSRAGSTSRRSSHRRRRSREHQSAPGASPRAQLLELPHARAVGEGERFWEVYRETTSPRVVRGNLVPDAHLVSLMRENGIDMLWSHDRDFKTFEGVTVRDPFDGL